MRTLVFLLVITASLLMIPSKAPSETLSKAERERAIAYLIETRDSLQKEVAGLSSAQLRFRTAADRWTIAEIVEHVAIVEKSVLALVKQLAQQPPNRDRPRESQLKEGDEQVIRTFRDRSRKLTAPEALRPTGIPAENAWRVFAEAREASLQFAQTTQADLRVRTQDTPLVKGMDGVQFLLFFGAHTLRHREQIREVKADHGFASAGTAANLAPLMERGQEIALARSAGLPEWAEKASIYVLERGGFAKAMAGSNGFTCLVLRKAGGLISPLCFDPEGSKAILPRILREAELEEMGKTRAQIEQETGERFRTGVYRAPRRIGIAYMLSTQNWVLAGKEQGKPGWFPPHLMFYAPYVNATQVGASPRPGAMFSIVGNGNAHTFMVVAPPEAMPPPPEPPVNHNTDLAPLMRRDEEIALAKSAGLPEWNQQATIYVLQRGGFVKTKDGTNGFSCLVIRDNGRGDWEPICYDPEGTETILPRRLRETELREQGKSWDEVRADTARRFASGEYRAPRRTGLAFMLTERNWGPGPGGRLAWFPPHVMVYSQGVRGAEIGVVNTRLPHTGVMLHEGDLHGYIVVPLAGKVPTGPAVPVAGSFSPFKEAATVAEHKHDEL